MSLIYEDIKIFSGNGNIALASSIATKLGKVLGKNEVGKFKDGETSVRIDETVRGCDIFIVQPTSAPVNDNLMELLVLMDACKRASAGRINAVIPYFGYARQDRKTRARDPISAKLVANLLTVAGADRVVSMDLHCTQIQGFFDIPVDNLRAGNLLAAYYLEKFPGMSDVVVVSPDLGSVARARSFADQLSCPLAIVDKRRPKANESEVMNIIGNIENKRIILLDDVIDTAGSLTNAANALRQNGALDIYACATHGVFSDNAYERIQKSAITELLVTNTIPQERAGMCDKIKTICVADIIAQAIGRIHNNVAVSELFE